MKLFAIITLVLLITTKQNRAQQENDLRFIPTKIYDFFTNSHPNCIIANACDAYSKEVKEFAKMLGNETLIISDYEYEKYNLSDYNIICIGNRKTNCFINSLELPYSYDEKLFAINENVIYEGNCNLMAVLQNPYCTSNNLLQIGEITGRYNNIFFIDAQFVLFKNDSVIVQGKYYSYLTNLPSSPSEEIHQTEFYPNTQLVKFPKIVVNKTQVDPSIFKVIRTNDEFKNMSSDFSNKKVVLLGENHYFKTIKEIEINIVFELNRSSYFPYLVIEVPYSYTSIINEFLSCTNDEKANKFFKSKMEMIAATFEDSVFYDDLRKWNSKNTNKKIQILCTDIEHDFENTIEQILIPKLNSAGLMYLKDSLISVSYLNKIKNELLNIETNDKVLPCLIDNLVQTYLAYNALAEKGYNHFNEIRQNAIIKKYEDTLFFGSIIRDSKFIVIAGSEHAGTKNEAYLSKNKEGYFLEYINPFTKGLTYSIRLLCLSYGINKSMLNKNEFHYKPRNYMKMVDEFKGAYINNDIRPEDTVFIFNQYDSFNKQLIEISSSLKEPFYFASEDINKFFDPPYLSFKDKKESEFYKNDYMKFDKIIIVLFSKLVNSR